MRIVKWAPVATIVLVGIVALAPAAGQVRAAQRRPNIILVITDDQRFDAL